MPTTLEARSVSTRAVSALLAAIALLVAAGCSSDETGGGDVGSGGAGGAGSSSSGEGGSADGTCSAMLGIECPEGFYCDFLVDICGGLDESGVCRPVPTDCPAVEEPTCGCDRQVHANACAANAAGVDLASRDDCTPPEGTVTCGSTFCTADEYCSLVEYTGGDPRSSACAPLPAACDPEAPDCACLASEPCADGCAAEDGRLTVTCVED